MLNTRCLIVIINLLISENRTWQIRYSNSTAFVFRGAKKKCKLFFCVENSWDVFVSRIQTLRMQKKITCSEVFKNYFHLNEVQPFKAEKSACQKKTTIQIDGYEEKTNTEIRLRMKK